MKEYFLSCGYPKTLVENGINKAKAITQLKPGRTKQKTKEDIITFVSTHNPNNPNMWQAHNLKRTLTRAKFTTNHTQGGSFKCIDKRCGTCQNIEETTSIKITATGEIFQIRNP